MVKAQARHRGLAPATAGHRGRDQAHREGIEQARGPFTGLLTIDELDERLTVYHDNDGWRRLTLSKLRAMGARKVAAAVGISERRARDILKGRAMPHPRNRTAMERLVVNGEIEHMV